MSMTKNEVIAYGLSLAATYQDQPFRQKIGQQPVLTLRHLRNHKIFAIISQRNGATYVALKGQPERNLELCEFFAAVNPAWHMNKRHWLEIQLGSDLTDPALKKLLQNSYQLTQK